MDHLRLIDVCLPLIPALPLVAAMVTALLGPWLSRALPRQQWLLALPVILALAVSSGLSVQLVRAVGSEQDQQRDDGESAEAAKAGFERIVTLWTWADVERAYALGESGGNTAGTEAFPADRGLKNLHIAVALRADALTAMMLAMVTFISTLVTIFAAGYMAGDGGYWRFFAYIGLFVFSMTMLVSASNFLLLFVFWEAVGACSYLLIGFWYEKPAAAAAGVKAFLVNRVGDVGFALALFLIWTTYGTLNFHDSLASGATDPAAIEGQVAAAAGEPRSAAPQSQALVRGVLGKSRLTANDYVGGGVATAICLLMLLGACGKSAQFPLHVWLPDAMEGPTPVSALIHAATMVTAGVYMVARCSPLFAASPEAQLTVAVIGAVTALLAGLIALTQFDLKRILAYSTVSQLGYMFLGLGTGLFAGVTGGMFHLFTHAFFKALLFLAAGSVMHAMGGVIDVRRFGGLRRLMPYTHATFLIGCLALAGIFPLAGFWSKDSILGAVHDKVHQLEHALVVRQAGEGSAHGEHVQEGPVKAVATLTDRQLSAYGRVYELLYYSALFTAFLTAFYTFRAFCLTFYGEEQIPDEAGHHAHESPPAMVWPLLILAIGAIATGLWGMGFSQVLWGESLGDFLGHAPQLASGGLALTTPQAPEFHMTVAGISTLVAVVGVGLALYLYLGDRSEIAVVQRALDLQGTWELTDPQWVTRLERVPWIGAITRSLRSVGLGFLVTLAGLLLGTLSLILALPLLALHYLSPYQLSANKFYIDEVYSALIVTPARWLASALYWIDRHLVDGTVDLAGALPPALGSVMRGLQGGLVQFYAVAMVLGVLILIAARILLAAG